jgi:hypothetical protein
VVEEKIQKPRGDIKSDQQIKASSIDMLACTRILKNEPVATYDLQPGLVYKIKALDIAAPNPPVGKHHK